MFKINQIVSYCDEICILRMDYCLVLISPLKDVSRRILAPTYLIKTVNEKKVLKDFVANAEMQYTFEPLRLKGCNIDEIEASFNKWQKHREMLRRTKTTWDMKDFDKYTEEYLMGHGRTILNLIDLHY